MKFYTNDSHFALLCKMAGFVVEGKDVKVKLIDGKDKVIRLLEVKTKKKELKEIFQGGDKK